MNTDRPFTKLPYIKKPEIFLAMPMRKNAELKAETAAYCSALNCLPMVKWGFVGSMSPEFSRNSLLEHHFHKDPNWTHVFFVDTDIVPPADALKKLLELDADIATGAYPLFLSTGIFWSVADEEGNWLKISEPIKTWKPFKTTSCGAGCLLIRREVLVKVGWPWFKTVYQEIYKNEGKGLKTGEDVFFCERGIAEGYTLACDPTVVCKHFNDVDMLSFYEYAERLIKDSIGKVTDCLCSSGEGSENSPPIPVEGG